ncbi:hypothetical protein JCM5350_007984, partial [Sporobolomyces pararoseus]
PVPPPIPPGYQQSSTSSDLTTALGGSAAASAFPSSSQSQPSSSSQAQNPDALPSFPAPRQTSSMPPTFGGGLPVAPPPQVPAFVQPRPPVPPTYSSAPVRMPYPYVPPPAAPPSLPAPVFTAPATGPPASIQPQAPLGDMFKTALAKKMFGSQLSDAPAKPTFLPTFGGVSMATGTVGGMPIVQYPLVLPQIVGVPQQPQAPGVQPQSQVQPRLPTPAAPANETYPSQVVTSSPSSPSTTSQAPVDHGVLPPMPIPQSITPPPSQLATVPSTIFLAPARPMSGLGGWILPPQTLTPLQSPEPSVSTRSCSPAPSSSVGPVDTPVAWSTPVPSVAGDASEDGIERKATPVSHEEDSTEYDPNASTPQPPSDPAPSTDSTDLGPDPYLSLPSLAALATPLPPSPAPGSIISSSTITPSATPAPPQGSVVPILPDIPSSTTSESEEFRTFHSISKDLPPPPPSMSPALPPLPPLPSDSYSILDLSTRVDSPAPTIPPRPFSSASLQSLPSIPPSLPSVSLERTPSLAISTESVPLPQSRDNLEVASIVLQPPTPIESNETQFETATTFDESTIENDEGESSTQALSPLTPLSLNLDLDSSFNFDSLDFSTPSIVPNLPDTQSYFSSLGLNFGGGGGGGEQDQSSRTVGEIERDEEGRLELPVLREENLLDDAEEDDQEEGDDMSEQFDAATSFVSGFHEADLARAKVDPGHTGRTEKWLEGQGMRTSPGIESLKMRNEKTVANSDSSESLSTIFRPRTAPPSSIPPSSLPPYQPTVTRSLRPLPSISSRDHKSSALSTLKEDDDAAPSPVQTMINFDKPRSALDRGREVSSTSTRGKRAMEKAREEEAEKMRRALGALSNSAFESSLL